MLNEKLFREVFYDAHVMHKEKYNVNNNRIADAIQTLEEENQPRKWNSARLCRKLNYEDAAYRCGYLHLYASCHASLLNYVLQKRLGTTVFDNLFADSAVINICSIGGGPGTEVIAFCAMFSDVPKFSNKVFQFTVVDCMLGWCKAFESVHAAAVKSTSYGAFLLSNTRTSFLQADMLQTLTQSVKDTIHSADLVTMVKFVSAASSEATPKMLKDIFTLMKPGAAVLFIDKAGGGYYELVENAAHHCGLVNHCGPFRHLKYENTAFRRKMYGVFALSSTTVAVQMWRKTYPFSLNGCEIQLLPERLLDNESKKSSNACYGSSALGYCSNYSSEGTSLESKETVSSFESVATVSCNISDRARSHMPVPKSIDPTTIAKLKSQAFSSNIIHCNQNNLTKGICPFRISDFTNSHTYSAVCQDEIPSGTSDSGNESIINVAHNSSTNLCSSAPVLKSVGRANRRKRRALSSKVIQSSQNTSSRSNSKEDIISNSDNEFNKDNSHVYHSITFPNQTSAISAGNTAKHSHLHTPGLKSSTSNAGNKSLTTASQRRNRRTLSEARHNNRNIPDVSNSKDSTASVLVIEPVHGCSHASHSRISENTVLSATSDADSGDSGIRHDFQNTDVQSRVSHQPKHRKHDNETTDCCTIL